MIVAGVSEGAGVGRCPWVREHCGVLAAQVTTYETLAAEFCPSPGDSASAIANIHWVRRWEKGRGEGSGLWWWWRWWFVCVLEGGAAFCFASVILVFSGETI